MIKVLFFYKIKKLTKYVSRIENLYYNKDRFFKNIKNIWKKKYCH